MSTKLIGVLITLKILFLDPMCYFLIAYIVKVLKMAIIHFKFWFCALDNEIQKLTYFLGKKQANMNVTIYIRSK